MPSRLTPIALLVIAFAFSGYQFLTTGRIAWIQDAYETVTEYATRPEAGWRKAASVIEGLGERREAAPGSFDMEGKVVGISDGDTITILEGERNHQVRLFGIDTPEREQPYYRQAKDALTSKISGATVGISLIDTDHYGRRVGIVYLGKRNINLEMVQGGHAWWYRRYAQYDRPLQEAEQEARAQKLGLWADPAPIAPWEWKRR